MGKLIIEKKIANLHIFHVNKYKFSKIFQFSIFWRSALFKHNFKTLKKNDHFTDVNKCMVALTYFQDMS